MSTHTPGPWLWDSSRTSLMGRKGAVVLADGEGVWDLCSYAAIVQGDAKRADADARLIAAAPDLLEALKAAVECGMVPKSSAADGGANRHIKQLHVADQIRAAIAKATAG